MAALQTQPPRSAAQLAVHSGVALPTQFQRAVAPFSQRPAQLQRVARRAVITSAKLAKSQQNGQPPFISPVDIVSSGLGAMVCTSFFVSRGQDPFEALTITTCSIVVALVLNQLLFANE